LNDRFGLTLDERDQLLFDQFEESWAANDEVSAQAKASSFDNFRLAFERVFLDTVVRRMDDNESIFKRKLDDQEFQSVLMDFYARRVFDRARESREKI
jgi:type I restriction enzyme R subunit